MKFSRRQLAQAFVKLSEDIPWQELVPVLAQMLQKHKHGRDVQLFSQDVANVWQKNRGEMFASVVSARELTPAALGQIEKYLMYQSGVKKVQLKAIVQPQVLGGAVVQTPTHEYDMSVRRFLDAIIQSTR